MTGKIPAGLARNLKASVVDVSDSELDSSGSERNSETAKRQKFSSERAVPCDFPEPMNSPRAGSMRSRSSSPSSAASSNARRFNIEQHRSNQDIVENENLGKLIENFSANREAIFGIMESGKFKVTPDNLKKLVQTQIDFVEDPDRPGDFDEISVLQLAKDDADILRSKTDIDRIGRLLLAWHTGPGSVASGKRAESSHDLRDKATLLESALTLKKISELCAFKYSEKFETLGFRADGFNVFEPSTADLMSALKAVASEANMAYQVPCTQIGLAVAPLIERSIQHALSALHLVKPNAFLWHELIAIAEKVIPPEIARQSGMDDTGTDAPSEYDSDIANLADFASDDEDQERRAQLKKMGNEGTTAGMPDDTIDIQGVSWKALPSINDDMQLTLKNPSHELTTTLQNINAQRPVGLVYERLDGLMEIAEAIQYLTAEPSKPVSEVKLEALARLKQTESCIPDNLLQEWRLFIGHLVSSENIFSTISTADESTVEQSERDKAAEILGETPETLQKKADHYKKAKTRQNAFNATVNPLPGNPTVNLGNTRTLHGLEALNAELRHVFERAIE